MKNANLLSLSLEALVDRYVVAGIAQYEAELDDNLRKFKRLFSEIMDIEAELKSRPGDQRTALLKLYNHANMQVRLNAAHATLAVAPEAARAVARHSGVAMDAPGAGRRDVVAQPGEGGVSADVRRS